MNEPMKPEFDMKLAAAVLEATLHLEFCERKLLAAMLQRAEWAEKYARVCFVGLMKETISEVTFQSCLNLIENGFVKWQPLGSCFRINAEKLIPQPVQPESTP